MEETNIQNEMRGPLSASELMKNLAKAKKVMEKVESKKTENNINEEYDDDYNDDFESVDLTANTVIEEPKVFDPEKVRSSKLPEVIKEMMIKHPSQQTIPENTYNNDIIKGAKRLMEQENGGITRKKQNLPPRSNNNTTQIGNKNTSLDYNSAINMLRPIIENIIRESIDKIVDAKIEKLLTAQQYTTLNENLMIKVGDSVFKGNINGATKIKK